MATLHGTSTEMEEQAKKLSDAELTEIAYLNDTPPSLKARGELARRGAEAAALNTRISSDALWWARAAGIASVIGILISVVAIAVAH